MEALLAWSGPALLEMIFTTIPFLVFLAVALPVYWALRSDKWRLPLLFTANFAFYGWWDWRFMGLLLLVVSVCYVGAHLISPPDRKASTKALYAGCGVLILLLGYFKYAGFFASNVKALIEGFGGTATWTTLNIILPVGISFYVFQGISYLVSVYRGTVKAEPSFIKLGVYLGFFPHLVAGPIIHAATFLPQLQEKRRFDAEVFLEGWRKFAIGFLYKSVFADNLAGPVDEIFKNPAANSPLSIFGGTLGFYGQIYFDFAGYSLMAIGVANMFGYFLPDNFNHPYRAASVVDFWRRWHISLSTWLRDYLYIPLGGSRGSAGLVYRNLFITMFLGGLWHGASWNFLLWGGIHGVALCVNHAWNDHPKSKRFVQSRGFPVFGFLMTQAVVFLCWIPFRAQTFADTAVILGKLAEIPLMVWETAQPFPWLLALVPLFVDTWFVGSPGLVKKWGIASNALFYLAVAVALLVALLFMHIGYAPFIYFLF